MRRVVAVVKDLFFVARIRETAKLVGTPLGFARSAEELSRRAGGRASRPGDHRSHHPRLGSRGASRHGGEPAPRRPRAGLHHSRPRPSDPALHGRCDRVVTKETLTQELPQILREGVPA